MRLVFSIFTLVSTILSIHAVIPMQVGDPAFLGRWRMPDDPMGIWYVDQYQSTPRRLVPNSASSIAVSQNQISAPRRFFGFANYAFYVRSSATVVDNAANGPDGKPYAASVVGTGNWALTSAAATYPAGTFTAAMDYKRNTGSDQMFRAGLSTSLITNTATASWQTWTQTVTFASGSKIWRLAMSIDGTTGAEILIDNFRIYPGSVDLGPQDLTPLHMYLGTDNYDPQPTVSGNVANMQTNAIGIIQLPDAITISNFTAIVVSRKNVRGDSFEAVLSSVQTNTQFASMHEAFTSGPTFYVQGTSMISQPSAVYFPTMYDNVDPNYQVMIDRYDGTTAVKFLNDVKTYTRTVSGKAGYLSDLWAGIYTTSSFPSKHNIFAWALYDRALSDVEVVSAYRSLKARAESRGLTVGFNRFLIAEGDSITAGGSGPSIANPYPNRFMTNASPLVHGIKMAVSGTVLNGAAGSNSLYGRQAVENAMIPAGKEGRLFIYSVLIGANDFVTPAYTNNPTQYAADVGAFLLAQKAAGWDKIALGTITPKSAAAFNAWRNTVNGIFTGAGWAAANGVDAIFDFAADPTIGTDAAGSDVTYYSDGTHPTDACIAIMEPIYRAAINGL